GNAGKLRAELHDRLTGPIYPFLFVMIAMLHLGFPRTTRESRIQDLFTAFTVATLLRVMGLAATNMAAKTHWAIIVIWAIPLAGVLVTMIMAHFEIKPAAMPSFSLSGLWPARAAKPATS